MNEQLSDLAAYDVLAHLEAIGLRHLMERFDYNQSEVALAVRMSRQTLRKRLRLHGIPTTSLKYTLRKSSLAKHTLRV